MTSGPDHYKEAERLISEGEYDEGADEALLARDIASAQVHATLALAAATALMHKPEPPQRDWNAWYAAAGTKLPKDEEAPA